MMRLQDMHISLRQTDGQTMGRRRRKKLWVRTKFGADFHVGVLHDACRRWRGRCVATNKFVGRTANLRWGNSLSRFGISRLTPHDHLPQTIAIRFSLYELSRSSTCDRKANLIVRNRIKINIETNKNRKNMFGSSESRKSDAKYFMEISTTTRRCGQRKSLSRCRARTTRSRIIHPSQHSKYPKNYTFRAYCLCIVSACAVYPIRIVAHHDTHHIEDDIELGTSKQCAQIAHKNNLLIDLCSVNVVTVANYPSKHDAFSHPLSSSAGWRRSEECTRFRNQVTNFPVRWLRKRSSWSERGPQRTRGTSMHDVGEKRAQPTRKIRFWI